MKRWISFAALAAAAAPSCAKDDLNKLRPAISVEPLGIDFLFVRPGTTQDDRIDVRSVNPSAPLSIESVRIDGPDAAYFASGQLPDRITASASLSVSFSPAERREYTATLLIRSDAVDDAEVSVFLRGEGAVAEAAACGVGQTVDGRCAVPEGGRPEVVFGEVRMSGGLAVDRAPHFSVRVEEVGTRAPLQVVALRFDEAAVASGFAVATSDHLPPFEVPAGSGVDLPLTLISPPCVDDGCTGPLTGTLYVSTDDPEHAEIPIALSAVPVSNLSPVACLGVRRVVPIRGQVRVYSPPRESLTTAEQPPPLAVATLTGQVREGCSGDPDGAIAGTSEAWSWSVVEWPDQADSAAPALRAGAGPWEKQVRLDHVGRYRVALTVRDSGGKTATAELELEARPQADIQVELSWPKEEGADLDLHFVRPGGGLCCENDCDFENCRTCIEYETDRVTCKTFAQDAASPDWGASGPFDNPHLDRDDRGYDGNPLLETTTLDGPENGTYFVAAHFYAWDDSEGGGPIEAVNLRMKIFIRGAIARIRDDSKPRSEWEPAAYSFQLPAQVGALWVPAQIVWNASAPDESYVVNWAPARADELTVDACGASHADPAHTCIPIPAQ